MSFYSIVLVCTYCTCLYLLVLLLILTNNYLITSVIFSYWAKMLDLLGTALQANHFEFERIDGRSSFEQRSVALKRFRESSSCTIMLATIGSMAEG